jgi:hypothetical protein
VIVAIEPSAPMARGDQPGAEALEGEHPGGVELGGRLDVEHRHGAVVEADRLGGGVAVGEVAGAVEVEVGEGDLHSGREAAVTLQVILGRGVGEAQAPGVREGLVEEHARGAIDGGHDGEPAPVKLDALGDAAREGVGRRRAQRQGQGHGVDGVDRGQVLTVHKLQGVPAGQDAREQERHGHLALKVGREHAPGADVGLAAGLDGVAVHVVPGRREVERHVEAGQTVGVELDDVVFRGAA